MTEPSPASRDAYYREAASWSRDRQDALRNSRRIAWIVAGAALAVAVLEAFALMLLTPLKTVEPYTLLVDRNTGYVQALKPLDAQRVSADAALTQSFLVQYVIARESFDADALQANYRKVALWSAERARAEYLSTMQASNPTSPLALYPRSTVVDTRVKSVSPIGREAVMVRFETRRRDAGARAQPVAAWVAVIRYRYSDAAMSTQDRYANPLGFQVLRYRRDAEALEPEPSPTPSPVPTYQPAAAAAQSPLARPLPRAAPTPPGPEL